MVVDLIPSLQTVDPDQFDRLDSSGGAVACYHRTRQRERDGRWKVQYVRATDGDRLLAVVPLYTFRSAAWADPAYDSMAWPLPAGSTETNTPGSCLLVGGNADLRSGLHVDRALQDETGFRPVLAAAAHAAATEGRGLIFPYLYGAARDLLDRATGGRIAWAPLGQEAQFPHALADDSEERCSSQVRRVLRRDRNLIAEQQVATAVWTWSEVEDEAAEVIAQHNIRKGKPDHPEFVRMRYAQWDDCPSVELTVFTARAGGVEGVTTALRWQDQLEVYEIALTGEDSPERLAVYVSLLFHQPARFGMEHGLRNLRGGLDAMTPKAMRGAVFKELYGGVLNAAATREVVNGR
ncbi:hypothetical protein [Streptomyces sp. NPDC047042]|uniref:hypothetical protein n=1 Tax=Streptomyces sp. NPDC047042 TaxID=3154807 RepID=UPI0033FA3339